MFWSWVSNGPIFYILLVAVNKVGGGNANVFYKVAVRFIWEYNL